MSKAHTYYYAQSTGKLKLYQLKYEKEYEGFNTDTYVYRLYIDGEKATSKDMVVEDDTGNTIYRIGDGYYNMFVYKTCVEATHPILIHNDKVYDIATGKITNVFIASQGEGKRLVIDKGIITGGTVFDIKNQMVCEFDSKSRLKSKSKFSTAFLITLCNVKNNSVGGAEPKIEIYNNSNKTIKYINYTVKFKNDVGDYVSCDITGDWSFRLKVTGPIKPHTLDRASWDPVMYDYAANHLVITSVSVEYMDGTTKSYSGDNIVCI